MDATPKQFPVDGMKSTVQSLEECQEIDVCVLGKLLLLEQPFALMFMSAIGLLLVYCLVELLVSGLKPGSATTALSSGLCLIPSILSPAFTARFKKSTARARSPSAS